jgi:hypothetical protein
MRAVQGQLQQFEQNFADAKPAMTKAIRGRQRALRQHWEALGAEYLHKLKVCTGVTTDYYSAASTSSSFK